MKLNRSNNRIFVAISLSFIVLILFPAFGQGWITNEKLSSSSSSPAAVYAQTTTLPDFNFGAVGDWGCNSNTQNTVNNIVTKSTELVLGLGDYSYQDTANCWLQIVDPIDEKMKISIGNHDDISPSLLNQYMSHFGLTKQYYSFNYQNVHFIVLSTELAYTSGSEQYNFVFDDLTKAAADPNIGWIVVFFHKLMYTSPTSHSAEAALRDTYHPLFDQYDVDLVLQAHNHNYQRTYPIKYNSNSPTSPIRTDTNTNNYNDPEGQIYATVGTGGISRYSFTGTASFNVFQTSSFYGFLNVDITNGGTRLSAQFYANDGSVKDQFSITKLSSKYHYEPYLTLSGSNHQDIPSSSSLKLTTFSLATWFRTSNDFAANSYIVNKGGSGLETAGQNMNYGIWMTSSEKIEAGFETSSGTNHFVTSSASYSDGQWHYAVLTYGGSTVRLYIDGIQVATKSTSGAIPDNTGNQPLRIGANSLALNGFFTGDVDEVRIWNRAVSASEVTDAYDNGVFNTNGQVLYLSFGTPPPPPPPPPPTSKYHYEPFRTYGGSQFDDTPDSPTLRLQSPFTVLSWFRTTNDCVVDCMIVNKGGIGIDQVGQNLNYGIWMTPSERISVGFESQAGTNYYATSPASYSDGQWHLAVLTFGGTTVRLYIDGVQVASTLASGVQPDNTGTQPLRIGANSRATDSFYTGDVDEAMVFNRPLSSDEIANYYSQGTLDTSGRVFYQSFGN